MVASLRLGRIVAFTLRADNRDDAEKEAYGGKFDDVRRIKEINSETKVVLAEHRLPDPQRPALDGWVKVITGKKSISEGAGLRCIRKELEYLIQRRKSFFYFFIIFSLPLFIYEHHCRNRHRLDAVGILSFSGHVCACGRYARQVSINWVGRFFVFDFQFEREHVIEAIRKVEQKGLDWLLNEHKKTGTTRITDAKYWFLIHEGTEYPLKHLGRCAYWHATKEPLPWEPYPKDYSRHFEELGFKTVHYNKADKRRRGIAEVLLRPGQAEFRRKVFKRWNARCLITGCTTEVSLEAAHIVPVAENGVDDEWNGLTLRADIHRLFDANLIWIDAESQCVHVADEVANDYQKYRDKDLSSDFVGIKNAGKTKTALKKRNFSSARNGKTH